MSDIETLKEKIAIVRNDTNAYGFDNDNINLADILEMIAGLIESNGTSSGNENHENNNEATASGSAFERD